MAFIFQASSNHYIGYFQNFNGKYSKRLNKLFRFNDIKRPFSKLPKNPD